MDYVQRWGRIWRDIASCKTGVNRRTAAKCYASPLPVVDRRNTYNKSYQCFNRRRIQQICDNVLNQLHNRHRRKFNITAHKIFSFIHFLIPETGKVNQHDRDWLQLNLLPVTDKMITPRQRHMAQCIRRACKTVHHCFVLWYNNYTTKTVSHGNCLLLPVRTKWRQQSRKLTNSLMQRLRLKRSTKRASH